ncbi:hypothetical protein GCM10027615_40630 [Plantactinospora veratri]
MESIVQPSRGRSVSSPIGFVARSVVRPATVTSGPEVVAAAGAGPATAATGSTSSSASTADSPDRGNLVSNMADSPLPHGWWDVSVDGPWDDPDQPPRPDSMAGDGHIRPAAPGPHRRHTGRTEATTGSG